MRRLLLVFATLLVMTLALRMLMVARGGGAFTPPARVTDWNLTRFAGNPVISTADNPNEPLEQYVPAPVQMPNGDVWVYVKGQSTVYAWKSVDGGETFTLENSGDPVIDPDAGEWDEDFALEPVALYDTASDTIHLWYKGTNVLAANAGWAWGHATATSADPTSFTKDPANPILTSATVSTALGGAAVADLAISDVVLGPDGTVHFYGYVLYDSIYRLIHATGSSFTNPSSVTILLSAASSLLVVNDGSVFHVPGEWGYTMFYSRGDIGSSGSREMGVAYSDDLVTWDFSDLTDIMVPTSGWESLRAHTPGLLKESQVPYLSPIVDGLGRWKLYYAGQSGGVADTGLAYLEPE